LEKAHCGANLNRIYEKGVIYEAGFWAHAQVYDLQQAHASRVVARAPKAYGHLGELCRQEHG